MGWGSGGTGDAEQAEAGSECDREGAGCETENLVSGATGPPQTKAPLCCVIVCVSETELRDMVDRSGCVLRTWGRLMPERGEKRKRKRKRNQVEL